MKSFSALAIGELCKVRLGSAGLGWAFPIGIDGPRRLVAILKLGEQTRPLIHEVRNFNAPCLSFGTEWEIETVLADNTLAMGGHQESPGAIHIHAGGTTMYLAPFSPEAVDEGYPLGLPTLEANPIPFETVSVLSWKVWANPAERARVGATPLIEFSLQ